MKTKHIVSVAAFCFLLFAFTRAEAQLSYSLTDLGTLGGNMSSANSVAGPGHNAAGMIVGSSTTADNAEHAFLFVGGQMYDLNMLCDLSLSNFKVLTVAKTIPDSCLIIGEGVTLNGEKHAFLLTPTPVDGGNWSYVCCQWVWIQEGGGWWWETDCHCYKWHGPPGDHPPCPPQPPHCWWWPLPCPPGCGGSCTPPPPPPDYCWTCIDGHIVLLPAAEVTAKGGKCYGSFDEAKRNCKPCWCCVGDKVVRTTWEDCRAKGGQCYDSPEEAKRSCGKTCWICVDGKVVQVSVAEAQQRQARCFPTQEEAQKYCGGEKCWICLDGRVVQVSVAEAQQRQAKCYPTQEEAQRNCGRLCWVCVDGQAVQVSEEDARARGLRCYSSQEEALRYCREG